MSPADAGPPIATVNPVNGELLQSFEPYDAVGVESRLAAAAAAVPVWAASTFAERARLLITVAELLEAELPDIAHTVTTEMGKPFAQAKGEVAKCAGAFRWFAEHAEGMLSRPRGGGRRLARADHLPTAGRGAGHHAVEFPPVAGDPIPRPRGHGRQRRPAQACAERAPYRSRCWRTSSGGPVLPTASSRPC